MRRHRSIPLLMAGLLTGCGGDSIGPGTVTPRTLTADELAVSEANTRFGLELLKQLHPAVAAPNLLVSPLSVSMALGMALNGAEDATYDAMRNALGFGAMPEDEVNAAYQGLIEQLRARDPEVEFRLANSVWYRAGFDVEQPFLDVAADRFDAEVRELDFSSPAAPSTISGWAEDATNGRIRDLIRQIDPLDVMFLVNAVYFKAPWSQPFEPRATRDGDFRTAAGSTVSTAMMSQDAAFLHFGDETAVGVELLYADSAFSMVLIMPAPGGSLDALIASLDTQRWQAMMAAFQPGRIQLTMPKFTFSWGGRLNDPLAGLGMGVAFDAQRADFDRISRSRDDLFISRVEHKSFIDVHELGTEAAAATSVGISVTSLPPQITFDRPFLFAIRERSSGTLLFAGRVGDPTEEGS